MNIIETKALTKRFGDLIAVNALDLKVKKGEVFGLLGPNGAGKTTIISMLSTILTPSSGSALVSGKDVKNERNSVRKNIGIVFQDPSLDEELTGYENMDFHGRLYGMEKEQRVERIIELLELVDLIDKKDVPVKNYSGGMKRRLEIARGLLHKPKVLFLDEPTLGLDPQTRRYLWEYIQNMNKKDDVTIMLTTHYMEEADELCDRIAIIDHGKIVALDSPKNLKKKNKAETLEDVFIELTGRGIREENADSKESWKQKARSWRRG
ncbi:ATP-binding cassette domain-containing protein [archaeon]|nr:ATP-binding cassette domain-containing protein [archaeon]